MGRMSKHSNTQKNHERTDEENPLQDAANILGIRNKHAAARHCEGNQGSFWELSPMGKESEKTANS